MSNNIQETVVVEAITQYGIKANGKFLNLSPNLKNSGVTPTHFNVGETYLVEIYTGPKGGKSINSYAAVTPALVQTPVIPLPPPPSLPRTTVHETPAPGGVAPVAPAVKKEDSEKMTKADWAAKDKSIECLALVMSGLKSPMLAQLVVGKNNRDALLTFREVVEEAAILCDELKSR